MRRSKKMHFTKLLNLRLLIGVVAVVLLVAGIWALNRSDNPTVVDTPQENTSSGAYMNLNPPTEAEKAETEARKKSLNEGQSTPPQTTSGKKLVYPVITSASHSEVYAYVSGVIEDGGTCTATAAKGSQVVTASSSGAADASYTGCVPIKISLPAGTWSVVVSYSSATSEGKSSALTVN